MAITTLPGRLALYLRIHPSANSRQGNYKEDAQTDLDVLFDCMYLYACTQAGFLIIWSLSAFFLIS